MMYLETRYYDNGSAEARLTKHRPVTDPDDNTGMYDFYVEEVDQDSADYESLQEWIEDLGIETDDIIQLVIDLEDGKWVDISAYI